MSQLNIKGLVENIKARTNIYTPIVEAVVNSIQAIDESGREDGEILITVKRSNQGTLGFALADISSIEIQDNGVGFNEIHRNSFDTLYSDLKIKEGGKGFGRFMFLKYFESVNVESIFEENGEYKSRKFSLGRKEEIIEGERVSETTEEKPKTTLFLNNLQEKNLEKRIETLAKKLLEKLLIYFINDDYGCPKIILKEEGEREPIVLNEYLSSEKHSEIQQVGSKEFTLKQNDNERTEETFQVKIFKIFYPKNQASKISLTAHNREVKETFLKKYIPEFADDFYEDFEEEETKTRKDYMIKTYVLGDYLDSHVSLERGDFNFPGQNDLFSSFSQEDIERKAAEITKEIFKDEVKIRSEKKRERIKEYVENAPWHKEYFEGLDMSLIPYKLTDDKIEEELHKAKFQQEKELKAKAKEIIENPDKEIDESVQELVEKISRAKMSDLTRYIALRKTILGLFKKSLEIQDNGRYSSENAVHSIIFPTRSDSDSTPYDHHNLWIIDEKLNFTQFVSSDQPLNRGTSERPDLLIYDHQMAFRGENEASNPITIFEFKKPQRDDFVNPSSQEDPVAQVIRYVNSIKKGGKYKTPKGRDIVVGDNTPFYGFVVCDLTQKVKDWLFEEKGFKVMPDGEGWFYYHDNNNLYLEVISWDKMLKDAEMRNKIFFDKLGL